MKTGWKPRERPILQEFRGACPQSFLFGIAIKQTDIGVFLLIKKFRKIPVIGLLPLHTFYWMEERGAETNGRSDPIRSPKISSSSF